GLAADRSYELLELVRHEVNVPVSRRRPLHAKQRRLGDASRLDGPVEHSDYRPHGSADCAPVVGIWVTVLNPLLDVEGFDGVHPDPTHVPVERLQVFLVPRMSPRSVLSLGPN